MEPLGRTSGTQDILAFLRSQRNETNIAGMRRFGIVTDTALGLSNETLRRLARAVGKDHSRALELWKTDVREARLLASYTADPALLTLLEARVWAADFNSWEIVDAVADLFVKSGHWRILIPEFAADERPFVRRAAFSMMACAAVHLKAEPDANILAFLPLIERHASDPRNFVKKAVNWALRQIGKRNRTCLAEAWQLAERLSSSADRTERWIGKDAMREFQEKFGAPD